MAVTNAEPARHRIRVGGHGLGDEVVVLARRQLFQADGLLELADLQVLAATADRVLEVGVEELRSEEHKSELQSLMRISYAVFCLKKKNKVTDNKNQSMKER